MLDTYALPQQRVLNAMQHSKAKSTAAINSVAFKIASASPSIALLSARSPGEVSMRRNRKHMYRPPHTGRTNTMALQSNIA